MKSFVGLLNLLFFLFREFECCVVKKEDADGNINNYMDNTGYSTEKLPVLNVQEATTSRTSTFSNIEKCQEKLRNSQIVRADETRNGCRLYCSHQVVTGIAISMFMKEDTSSCANNGMCFNGICRYTSGTRETEICQSRFPNNAVVALGQTSRCHLRCRIVNRRRDRIIRMPDGSTCDQSSPSGGICVFGTCRRRPNIQE